MIWNHRSRRPVLAALTAAAVLALAACAREYPNSTLTPHSEFGRAIDYLWDRMLLYGTIVFVLVEAVLLYTVFRFRRREGGSQPRHVHGNTTLEIAWTLIPAFILVLIAVPTVRTIFRTQAKAVPNALQVEVIGHQWWWEFRYPQLGVTTANELYLPIGRTVNFSLRTADVLHAFWVPQLGGKRDLIANHTNYLWFTVDSAKGGVAWNGNCTEYCGASHANMRIRAFTVSPAQFDRWVALQKSPAAVGAVAAPAAPPLPPNATGRSPTAVGLPGVGPNAPPGPATAAGPAMQRQGAAVSGGATTPPAPAVAEAGFFVPLAQLPSHVVPHTPLPARLPFQDNLVGNVDRGRQIYSSNACIGCHVIQGNPMSVGNVGPNLTHVGSRTTIAAGTFPNDRAHLARWIKNARMMKEGVLMPTLGKGQYDPVTKQTVKTGGLDDQQIADIVAYLEALK